ncbi:MAG: glycoside hydrolase family 88 protein [Bacteroidota bacterium]
MRNTIFGICCMMLGLCSSCGPENQSIAKKTQLDVNRIVDLAAQRYSKTLATLTDTLNIPRNARTDGTWNQTPSWDWTSGFFSGTLWQIYALTGDKKWAKSAQKWSNAIASEVTSTNDHDLGFQFYCSFGNELRLFNMRTPGVKEILRTASNSLTSRYNPKSGVIRSWDWGTEKGVEPTIIDNMMNLELLMWAFGETRDSTYYYVTLSHADTTLKNHFRKDFSTYHVVDYDSISGKVIGKRTVQGHSKNSMWARGQAWAIYGYAMMYRETGIPSYLEQAKRAADVFLGNLPQDGIPFWDFNAPDIPNSPKDASAGAITASALLELASFEEQPKKSMYFGESLKILKTLSADKYLIPASESLGLVHHSTGHFTAGSEVDDHIIYADYYYLEALNRYQKLNDE